MRLEDDACWFSDAILRAEQDRRNSIEISEMHEAISWRNYGRELGLSAAELYQARLSHYGAAPRSGRDRAIEMALTVACSLGVLGMTWPLYGWALPSVVAQGWLVLGFAVPLGLLATWIINRRAPPEDRYRQDL